MPPREPLPAPDLDPAHDPGFADAGERAEAALANTPAEIVGEPLRRGETREIRIGTASWTDPTMVRANVFYPRGKSSAEERLKFYASQFSVVEVDATYYSLPERSTAHLWAERTPANFAFHVKAHALMTGQPTEVARLPIGLVELLPANVARKKKIYAKDLPPELNDAVWTNFIDALTPLSDTAKLGGILLQYPKWYLPTPENKDLLAAAAMRLAGIPATVEFRNIIVVRIREVFGVDARHAARSRAHARHGRRTPGSRQQRARGSGGDDTAARDDSPARSSRRDMGGAERPDGGAVSVPLFAGGTLHMGAVD